MVAAGVQQNEKEKAAGVTPQLVAVDEERKLDGGCSPVKQDCSPEILEKETAGRRR